MLLILVVWKSLGVGRNRLGDAESRALQQGIVAFIAPARRPDAGIEQGEGIVKKKRFSRKASAACAKSGNANLRAWREGVLAPAVAAANEKVKEFERKLRAEFPDPPAVVVALIESAIASFMSLSAVTVGKTIGSLRIDKLERAHALQVEAQRTLYRAVRALAAFADTPEAREAVLRRITASVPAPTLEDTAARIKSEVDAAKKKFAWIETGGRPDE
jgi:hypothetical protein